jgi:hypothetical protein
LASISAAILCDFAQVREGLLFVVSGGITRRYSAELPAPLGMMLGLLVEIPAQELAQVHDIEIIVKRTDTAEDLARMVAGVQAEGETQPGESLMVPAAVDLRGVAVQVYGSHDVRVTIDGDVGTFLTIYVLDKPPT